LHNETFWLGWATMAQGGWLPGAVAIEQSVADFMDLFYGREVSGMAETWQLLQSQARFWEKSWDRVESRERPPAYGNSEKKYPFPRRDMTLTPPALPDAETLAVEPVFTTTYAELIASADERLAESDRLLARLHEAHGRAGRNRYNIEVLLSIASLVRHHVRLIQSVARAEGLLVDAAAAHADGKHDKAAKLLAQAHGIANAMIEDLDETYARLKATWEVSRYEKGRSVDGRHFVHIQDDVKDHWADRRADLSYMIAPERSIGLAEWRNSLAEIIAAYSQAQGVTVRVAAPHE
jgi:hypothetical protein